MKTPTEVASAAKFVGGYWLTFLVAVLLAAWAHHLFGAPGAVGVAAFGSTGMLFLFVKLLRQ